MARATGEFGMQRPYEDDHAAHGDLMQYRRRACSPFGLFATAELNYRKGHRMNVKDIFDHGALQYDLHRRKIIPCFDDFYRTAVELIPFSREEAFSFLDLGAGTGLMTALILNAFPKARAGLLDISEKMLTKAMTRFADNTRVEFWVMDYAQDPLPGEHDLVVSAMSIHHLEDADKKSLMEKIYQALCPGGMFIHAELARGATVATENMYQRRWDEHLEKSGIGADQMAAIRYRMSYDKPAVVENQLLWLRQAGFVNADCFYKFYNFVVTAGKKPLFSGRAMRNA
jgi:tRNA (cmo5U34)-methyltransferase